VYSFRSAAAVGPGQSFRHRWRLEKSESFDDHEAAAHTRAFREKIQPMMAVRLTNACTIC